MFTATVRGLYFEARDERIPDAYEFSVKRYFPWDFQVVWYSLKHMHWNERKPCGNQFGVRFLSAIEDPMTSFWFLCFYDRVVISVGVVKPGLDVATGSGSQPTAKAP